MAPLRVLHPGPGRATIDNNPPGDGFPDPFDRVFEVGQGASLTLDRIIVTDGGDPTGSADGGGILALGDLTLLQSVVRGNEAPGYGGGIKTQGDVDLALRRSTVDGNRATGGAGIFHSTSAPGGALELVRSTISDNRGGLSQGGGIYFSAGGGPSSILDSTISGNRAQYEGGGIYVTNGELTVKRTTVSDNRAGTVGGGLSVDTSAPFDIQNSTVAANRADGTGGGIHAQTDMSANAITVARNLADADGDGDFYERAVSGGAAGGGIFLEAGYGFEMENSLIALNGRGTGERDDCTGEAAFDSQGYNLLSSDEACLGFDAPGDLVAPDPRIGRLADNGGPTSTIALLAGSPAIGAARNDSMPAVDQRGQERQDPDIGAFERQP